MSRRVKIQRLPAGTWGVSCPCAGATWDLWLAAPWAVGKTWDIALALAAWHVELHEERDCECCGRGDRMPRVEILGGEVLRFDSRLYGIARGRVRRIRVDVA